MMCVSQLQIKLSDSFQIQGNVGGTFPGMMACDVPLPPVPAYVTNYSC